MRITPCWRGKPTTRDDPIIFYAIFQIFDQHLCYGRYMRLHEFIEDIDEAHTGWSDVVAPLTLFPQRYSIFSASTVVSFQSDD